MTVGRTKEMPQPPMPCVIQIMRNGMKVGSLKRLFTCEKSHVFAFMVGASAGKDARIASFSSFERNFTVSGSG